MKVTVLRLDTYRCLLTWTLHDQKRPHFHKCVTVGYPLITACSHSTTFVFAVTVALCHSNRLLIGARQLVR
jgi:hypothetical protein